MPDIIFNPATVCYGQSVAANVTASGGTANYSYEWPNGEMIADPAVLEPDNTYIVIIRDNNGCISTEEVVVPPVKVNFIRG